MAKSVVFIGLWILGNDYIIGSILLHYLSCKGLRGGWKRCLYWAFGDLGKDGKAELNRILLLPLGV